MSGVRRFAVLTGVAGLVLAGSVHAAAAESVQSSTKQWFGTIYRQTPAQITHDDGSKTPETATIIDPSGYVAGGGSVSSDDSAFEIDAGGLAFRFLTTPHRGFMQVDTPGLPPGCSDPYGRPLMHVFVRDVALSGKSISRIDLSYGMPCQNWQSGGYVFGEVAYAEPVATPLQTVPRRLDVAPSSAQSANTTYPVEIGLGQWPTAHVAGLAVRGSGARYFRLSGDTCTGYVLDNDHRGCAVQVTYTPHASYDAAELVALGDGGQVLSTTPLTGAALPGSSSLVTDSKDARDDAGFQSGATTPFGLVHGHTVHWPYAVAVGAGLEVPTESGIGYRNSNDNAGFIAEVLSDRPLGAGTYPLAGNPHVKVVGVDDDDRLVASGGVLRIVSPLGVHADRGLGEITSFGASWVLRFAGHPGTVRGAVSVNTAHPARRGGLEATSRLGDFDGDGATDFAVFRPSTGQWFMRERASIHYGVRGDVPAPGDYNGDGISDLAVFRPSSGQWFVRGHAPIHYGVRGDVPVAADYDGNGVTDLAVFRPSTAQWFVRGHAPIHFGVTGDQPQPGVFNDADRTEIAVYRPSTGQWFLRGHASIRYGIRGDRPATVDFDGDGRSDLAVFRPSTGQWFTRGQRTIDGHWPADAQPAPGDYVSRNYAPYIEGSVGPAVFRPADGQWQVGSNLGGSYHLTYGVKGDVPV